MANQKHRLLTRSDMDGLVCAVLLKELDIIDDISFVHPKDAQDGKVEVTDRDILTNLPYVEGCHLCFDHHESEELRNDVLSSPNLVLRSGAESAARVVFDHYGGHDAFGHRFDEMMAAVDKADAAQFTREEVLDPQGWTLLSFLMDARTGLGRFRDFRVSNYQLMMQLIDCCKDMTIDEILELPDVKERVDLYNAHREPMREQLSRCSTVHGKVVVLDLREEETIYTGNRFMIYAMYPQCSVSIHAIWGLKRQNTVFPIGKSIFDRSSRTDIGMICLEHDGGGHDAAGTCQIPNDEADRVLADLIERINAIESGADDVASMPRAA
ncbi:MAG: exopolyphosphatase [Planctomycetota bacterium]|jgi:nanoRNase/pAp phosphatase (c-di-AMP/oligoRNAs hydrolase)